MAITSMYWFLAPMISSFPKNFEQFVVDDCSGHTKEYSINLKIDHPRIKLDADIQQGYIECREKVPSGNWG